jgi:hypothetical protein
MPQPRIYQKGLESAAVLTLWYDRAIRDDRKFTIEDIDETALAAGALTWIWLAEMPPVAKSIPPVAAIVATGAVVSYAIGGEEGYYDYVDFVSDATSLDVIGVADKGVFTGETLGGAAVDVIEEQTAKAAAGLQVLVTVGGNILENVAKKLDKVYRRIIPGYRLRPSWWF